MGATSVRTVFITSFHGLVSRVLESGVIAKLVEENVSIVILVPEFKKSYFEETFGRYRQVEVVGVSRSSLSRMDGYFHALTFPLLHTKTMSIIRRSHRGYRHRYQLFLAEIFAGVIGRFRMGRELFRSLNAALVPSVFNTLFEIYKPSLVFSTDMKDPLDSQLLLEAKRRGITTVGMVRSWDYLTGKGVVRVKPERVIVHNEIIKKEAKDYIDVSSDAISVVGIPHYDPYVNEKRSSREMFSARVGLDPKRPFIFLAPWGDKFSDTDTEVLQILCRAFADGRLPKDLQVLVRLPPSDTLAASEKVPCGNIVFDVPGKQFEGRHVKANEMTYDDLLHLADSLYWSTLVVSSASTIAIDAAVFDKPVVLTAFDGRREKPYYESVKQYFDFNHVRNLLATGGVRVAENESVFIEAVKNYLTDPHQDRNGRVRIVREQCLILDGKASERLVALLMKELNARVL